MQSSHCSARIATIVVVTSLTMTLVSGNAIAAPPAPAVTSTPAGASTAATQNDLDDAAHEIQRRLSSVPKDASAEEAAMIIYPNDPEAQAEYIDLAQKVDQAASTHGGPHNRIVPALLVRFIPLLVKCVAGGAASSQIGSAVWSHDPASVNEMVEGAIGGCILVVVPTGPLRAAAEAAKPHIVAAVAAVIIRMSRP